MYSNYNLYDNCSIRKKTMSKNSSKLLLLAL